MLWARPCCCRGRHDLRHQPWPFPLGLDGVPVTNDVLAENDKLSHTMTRLPKAVPIAGLKNPLFAGRVLSVGSLSVRQPFLRCIQVKTVLATGSANM